MILCVTVFFYTERMAATTVHKKKVLASFKNKKTQESLFKSKEKSAEGVRSTQNAVNLSEKDGGKSNVYTNQQLYHMV